MALKTVPLVTADTAQTALAPAVDPAQAMARVPAVAQALAMAAAQAILVVEIMAVETLVVALQLDSQLRQLAAPLLLRPVWQPRVVVLLLVRVPMVTSLKVKPIP